MQARDVMTERVITVGLDTPVADVAHVLLDERISAVPVENPEGRVVGIVSEADLMHRVEIGPQKSKRWWLTMSQAELADAYLKTHGLRARDVMHEGVHSILPGTDLMEVVAIMEKKGVKRLLVIEGGRLKGIVTRANILRGLLAGREAAAATQDDRAIRAAILDELKSQPWTAITGNNIMVADGVVSFWGDVASDKERDALKAAAESTPGVKRVEDHTKLTPRAAMYWD